jgi:hypothetical protein
MPPLLHTGHQFRLTECLNSTLPEPGLLVGISLQKTPKSPVPRIQTSPSPSIIFSQPFVPVLF